MGITEQKYTTTNLEDEKEYVVEFEIINLSKIIENIQNESPYSDSPVYTKVIIPELLNIISKLNKLDTNLKDSIIKKSKASINDIIKETL